MAFLKYIFKKINYTIFLKLGTLQIDLHLKLNHKSLLIHGNRYKLNYVLHLF